MYNNMLDLKKHLSEGYEQRIKDGVYQWMVDHSTVIDDGRLRVVAYIDGKENFWKRASYRIRGEYARYQEIEKEQEKKNMTYGIGQRIAKEKVRKIAYINNGKNYYKKFLWFIHRKITKYLFG